MRRALSILTLPLFVVGLALATTSPAVAKTIVWKTAKKVNGSSGINALACPSAKLCVAAGYESVAVTTDPTGGRSAWKRRTVDRTLDSNDQRDSLTAVGCVSASACTVGDDDQNGWFSSSPRSGSWDPFQFPYETYVTVEAIGCSPLGNCTALSVDNHAMSTTSLSASSSWNFVQLPGTNPNAGYSTAIASVSCPSHMCILARSSGDVYLTADAGTKWKKVHIAHARGIDAVDCVTASFCIAGASEGSKAHVWVSRNPGAASSWRSVSRFARSGDEIFSVGCATTRRCFVGTGGAGVYSSSSPTNGRSWKLDKVHGGFGNFNQIACPSAGLCVAADQFGDVAVAKF